MLPLSVTFDHRVMDGEPFARFATALTERLENPELLLA
jgi:pyruvate/2-oxoglutarate dehydrogenase complex dihydrolipoamide acyltransferase (E2) component